MPRKKKDIHYIYKTTCLVTDRYYIGMHSTSNIDDGYMGSGKRLRLSIRKHGEDNHKKDIVEFYDSRDLLVEAEKEAITEDMIADKDCMNLKGGGDGGFISEEQQRHRSSCAGKARGERLKNDSAYAKRSSEMSSSTMKQNHKDGKMRYDTFKGKSHSEETKKKMRKSKNKGSTNPQYGTCWITRDGENKKIKKGDTIPEGWSLGRKTK